MMLVIHKSWNTIIKDRGLKMLALKKSIWLSLIVCLIVSASLHSMHPPSHTSAGIQQKITLLKKKLSALQDRLLILKDNLNELKKNLERPQAKLIEKFYTWSFLNTGKEPFENWNSILRMPDSPNMGQYGDPYVLTRRLLIIAFDPSRLAFVLDNAIFQILANHLGPFSNRAQFFQELTQKGVNLTAYIRVHGTDNLYGGNSADKTFNMLYHGFLSKNYGQSTDRFQQNILMGAFNLDGVEAAEKTSGPMPINSLQERDVHFHDEAMSPNNARLKISAERNISSFWSVGITLDKKRVVITYHFLINNKDSVEQEFYRLRDGSGEWLTLLDNIKKLLEFDQIKKNHLDSNAVKNFVEVLKKL